MPLAIAELVDADAPQPGKPPRVQLPRHHPLDSAADRRPRNPQQPTVRRPVRHLRQIRRQLFQRRRERAVPHRPPHPQPAPPGRSPASASHRRRARHPSRPGRTARHDPGIPGETGGLLREPGPIARAGPLPAASPPAAGSSPERSPARSCNCSMCFVGFALTWSSMPPVDSPRGDLRHTRRRPEAQNGCRLAKHPHNLSRHVAGLPNENDSESGCSFQQDDGPTVLT